MSSSICIILLFFELSEKSWKIADFGGKFFSKIDFRKEKSVGSLLISALVIYISEESRQDAKK